MKLETILEIHKKIAKEKGERIQLDPSPRDPILYEFVADGLKTQYWIFPENETELKISYYGTIIYKKNQESNPIADQIKSITLTQILPYSIIQKYNQKEN